MALKELDHTPIFYDSDAVGRSFASQLAKVNSINKSKILNKQSFFQNHRNYQAWLALSKTKTYETLL